jgi:hypothetical protein
MSTRRPRVGREGVASQPAMTEPTSAIVRLAQRIHEGRFDLGAEEFIGLLKDLHSQRTQARSDELTPHHVAVEECVDGLFDLFALDQLPDEAVQAVLDDIVADWSAAEPDTKAAMVATLNRLAKAHPVREYLVQHETEMSPAWTTPP